MSHIHNQRITSSGTREIVDILDNKTGLGVLEYISLGKEFHKLLLKYNVAMRWKMEGNENPRALHFFRNTKGKCFSYGVGKDIARFREKYILGLKLNEVGVGII